MWCLKQNWKLASLLCKISSNLNSSVYYLLLLVLIVLIWWSYLMHACMLNRVQLHFATPWSPPGSSVRGSFQARILEWLAISYFSRYSRPKDRTSVSCTGRRILYHSTTWEARSNLSPLHTALSFLKTTCVHREATFPRTVDLQACDK